jgi:general nucleoside transport system permease protein
MATELASAETATAQTPVGGQRLGGLAASLIAILVGLALGAIVFAAVGVSPLGAYGELVRGGIGSRFAIYQTLEQAVPLAIIAIGLCVSFRASVWNIGAEGQLYIGALAGALVGIYLPIDSAILMIPLTFLAAMAGGGVWGYIAGWLRAHMGVNEIVTTLMLNYIALFFVTYLIRIPFRDPENLIIQSKVVQESARLRDLPGTFVHAGILVAVVLVPIVAYLLNRTPFGFRVTAMGLNRDAAEAAGADTKRIIKRVMVISGALAGLAGIIQIEAIQLVMNGAISRQFGFTAIVVALLGRNHPLGAFITALFLGFLTVGGISVQQVYQIPTAIILGVEAMFVLLVLAAERLFRR